MEYRIELFGALPAPATVAALLEGEDAAAVADFDGSRLWRINTSLASEELLALFARAGARVSPAQVERVPSVCCGGCSG